MIVFTGVRLIPGDPARVMAGTEADAAGLEEIRQKYGLNDAILVQYLRWVGLALRGDLGESIRTRETVTKTVSRKLPITLELACLSILVTLATVLMRQTRNSMIEVLTADYIRTAYSKGLAGRAVIFRHAIRNGLIPVVTILGLQMGALMGGAVVTEQIFVVPGFGRLIVESVFTRDYPLVQGVVLITASAYVLINLLVDVSYSLLNPRIRIKGAVNAR